MIERRTYFRDDWPYVLARKQAPTSTLDPEDVAEILNRPEGLKAREPFEFTVEEGKLVSYVFKARLSQAYAEIEDALYLSEAIEQFDAATGRFTFLDVHGSLRARRLAKMVAGALERWRGSHAA